MRSILNKTLLVIGIALIPHILLSQPIKTRPKDTTRVIKVVVYPINVRDKDSDYAYMIRHWNAEIRSVFYNTPKYTVISRSKEDLQALMHQLIKRKECKTYKCAKDTIASTEWAADVAVSTDIYHRDGKIIVEFEVIRIDTTKTILHKKLSYSSLTTFLKNVNHDIKKTALYLQNEISVAYYKKDWVLDIEASISGAYAYNTGGLRFMLNGWGAVADIRIYGLLYNTFLRAELGFLRFHGDVFYEDSANYFPFIIGAGYLFRFGATRFSFSPSIGVVGLTIAHYTHGKNTIPNVRGFLREENSQKIDAKYTMSAGFSVEYQIWRFKLVSRLSDYVYCGRKEAFHQIIMSSGIVYIF